MEENDLRELRAYKLGYDLGWFRACEAVKPLLEDLQDCLARSATWREIEDEVEREDGKRPLYMARVTAILADMNQLRRETMPALVLEQKAINEMGKRLEGLDKQDWESLAATDNSSLVLGQPSQQNRPIDKPQPVCYNDNDPMA